MKFKFKGKDGQQDIALIQSGVLDEFEELKKGKVYEVPKKSGAIDRLRENGLWEEVKSKQTIPKPTEGGS